jgi:hypothetical protein
VPTPCTTPGSNGCPYSQPQSCTGPDCGTCTTPGSNGCPYSQPQSCTGPSCTAAASCRGPNEEAQILQIRADMSGDAPKSQKLLSDYQELMVKSGLINFVYDFPLSDQWMSNLDIASEQLVPTLQKQAQRVEQLNILDSLWPCGAGASPGPTAQPSFGTPFIFVPGGGGFIRGGGGFDTGGGHVGGSDSGGRGGGGSEGGGGSDKRP